MASDSAATLAARPRTLGQQTITKIRKISDHILFASTGAVGMSQLIEAEILHAWNTKTLATKNPVELMGELSEKIRSKAFPFLHSGATAQGAGFDVRACQCMVAVEAGGHPCLFQFGLDGAPEMATEELPFVAFGSGQPIADPFLAFLKRVLWQTAPAKLPEGRLVAAWTIHHAVLTNPGGVGGPIQLGVLDPSRKPNPIQILAEDRMEEHYQNIDAAEHALGLAIRPPRDSTTAFPPSAPHS